MLLEIAFEVLAGEGGLAVATGRKGWILINNPPGIIYFMQIGFLGMPDDPDKAMVFKSIILSLALHEFLPLILHPNSLLRIHTKIFFIR